jgi:hypothetical protein
LTAAGEVNSAPRCIFWSMTWRGFQNLVGRRRQIAPPGIAHHQEESNEEGQLRHDRAPVARAELPGTGASTAQRKQSRVADGHQDASAQQRAPPLTARTP